MRNQEWYTPTHIIQALGEFDLDPCAPVNPLYQTAKHTFNKITNGLLQSWFGRVWMNPPYGNLKPWFLKMTQHNNGIVLIPARTDTKIFHSMVFQKASSILFLAGRLHFIQPNGETAEANCGCASVLIAYNEFNAEILHKSGLPGRHIFLQERILVLGFDSSWRLIVKSVVVTELHLQTIYEEVEKMAPSKVRANVNYRAKIRQILQVHFTRTAPATYGP